MKLAFVAAFVCAACSDDPAAPKKLVFERWSPPQPTSYDIFLGARGDLVVMAHRFSQDAGVTWQPLDSRVGIPTRVVITDGTIATYANGLVRWDVAASTVTPVTGAPSYTTDRSWRVNPTTGRFITMDAVENAVAVETDTGWITAKLPQPSATELRPYIKDIESNGHALLAISAWGVHRSIDSGASWQFVTSTPAGSGRDLIVLADGRFLIVGGMKTYAFTTDGQLGGLMPGLAIDDNTATVCDDGAIIAGNKVSRDYGATWQSLLTGAGLQPTVQRTGCGGGRYWAIVLSDAWGYRLVRYDTLGEPGIIAGNWDATGDQAWSSSGPPIVRAVDGTFLAAGLALAPGATTWTLQEMPSRTWASGPTLFGVSKQQFYTSYDDGLTWRAAAAQGLGTSEPEAFARSSDGALHVGQFTGMTDDNEVGTWRSQVWQSRDDGATWAVVYNATATRLPGEQFVGEVHRFVGVLDDGTWIATDAVSHDAGVTWTKTDVDGDRGLAHLTPKGSLVTGGADEDLWRVYSDGGRGELTATWQMVVDGKSIPAAQMRTVTFDDDGYAYTARGTPNALLWRSNLPVD